jgi:hypothetical protein
LAISTIVVDLPDDGGTLAPVAPGPPASLALLVPNALGRVSPSRVSLFRAAPSHASHVLLAPGVHAHDALFPHAPGAHAPAPVPGRGRRGRPTHGIPGAHGHLADYGSH